MAQETGHPVNNLSKSISNQTSDNNTPSDNNTINPRSRLRFNLSQHARDVHLMSTIIVFFGCGTMYLNRQTFSYNVYGYQDNMSIVAFFEK